MTTGTDAPGGVGWCCLWCSARGRIVSGRTSAPTGSSRRGRRGGDSRLTGAGAGSLLDLEGLGLRGLRGLVGLRAHILHGDLVGALLGDLLRPGGLALL